MVQRVKSAYFHPIIIQYLKLVDTSHKDPTKYAELALLLHSYTYYLFMLCFYHSPGEVLDIYQLIDKTNGQLIK